MIKKFNYIILSLTSSNSCCIYSYILLLLVNSTPKFMAMKSSPTLTIIKPRNTSNSFDYLYFFYYKLLGINFGGFSIDKNGCLKKSFGWKVYNFC